MVIRLCLSAWSMSTYAVLSTKAFSAQLNDHPGVIGPQIRAFSDCGRTTSFDDEKSSAHHLCIKTIDDSRSDMGSRVNCMAVSQGEELADLKGGPHTVPSTESNSLASDEEVAEKWAKLVNLELGNWTFQKALKQLIWSDGGKSLFGSPLEGNEKSILSIIFSNLASRSPPAATGELIHRTFKTKGHEWIESIADLDKAYNFLHPEDLNDLARLTNRKQWIEQMFNFFDGLLEYRIVDEHTIATVLNQHNNHQFIVNQLLDRVKGWDFGRSHFLNFNIRLSLLQDTSFKKMIRLSQLLTHQTWGKVEFSFLNHEFERFRLSRKKYGGFIHLKTNIFKVFSFKNTSSARPMQIRVFLEELIHFVTSSLIRVGPETFAHRRFRSTVKLSYNMLSFILRYCHEDIPRNWTEQFKDPNLFDKLKLFEETMGLVSSIFHSVNVRYIIVAKHGARESGRNTQDYMRNIEELFPLSPHFEKHSIGKHRIWEFYALSQDSGNSEHIEQNDLNDFASQMEPTISNLWVNEAEEIQESLIEPMQLYPRFSKAIRTLKEKPGFPEKEFVDLMIKMKDWAISKIQYVEKDFRIKV